MTRKLPAWALLALLTFALALGACRRDPEAVAAPGDPVAAVNALAKALRDNDLVRYSRLSLPPDLHARSEALWNQRVKAAEPIPPEDAAEYEEMMARFTSPKAEAELMRDLEPKLAKFESEVQGQWPMMQAAGGMFLNAAIQANTELSAAEKAHGGEVVSSLMAWAQPALFTDRKRARTAISALVETAREVDLPTLAQARALPMLPALEKGGVAFAGFKRAAKAYDLDLDRSLDGVKAELVSADGDNAIVKVGYPFLDQDVSFNMALVRRDGGWYSADAIRQAEEELAEAAEQAAAARDDASAEPAAAAASAD